jgi:hypothetical protein
MNTKDISNTRDPDLRTALAALKRAALLARQTAIQTETELVVMKNGMLQKISAKELRLQAAAKP